MDWPIVFKDRLVLSNLDSNVGIVTLWTPKESIASNLPQDKFAVCGQLYTKRGISPMLRNILANPKIRYLIICGNDRQGSGDALLKFFQNGVTKNENLNKWEVIDDSEALIDSQLPFEALELIRAHVEILDMRPSDVKVISEKLADLPAKEAFSEPQEFEFAEDAQVVTYPSDLSVFKIRRDYIGDAWLDVLNTINRFGQETPGMYGKVKAVHNLAVVIEQEDPHDPKIYDFFNFKRDSLEKYYEGFFDKNEARTESYTYGERIFDWDGIDQEKIMVEKLTRFPFDRGAMAVLWKPHKDNFPPDKTEMQSLGQTKGWRVPCLVMLLAQCIGDRLYMTATFRNNDMHGAWPLNAFALRLFQAKLAEKIGKSLGPLTTVSQLAEIYEPDFADSLRIVSENNTVSRSCQFDTRSYYIVTTDDTDIVLTFYSPDGSRVLAEYRKNGTEPKAARDLCALVFKDMLIENLGAAADLGRQLAKAETAVKLGLEFEQDKPLKLKPKKIQFSLK